MGTPPHIVRAASVSLEVPDLAASRAFYVELLGFVEVGQEGERLLLRGYEEREWSLELRQGREARALELGFKVAAEEDLEELEALAREEGLPYRWDSGPERQRLLCLEDPFGLPLSFFAHSVKHERLLQEYHRYRGPGILRFDHLNAMLPTVGEATRWYQERLGFRLTEYTEDEQGRIWASWLHRKGNVHDLALTNGRGPRLHHFAYWLPEPMSLLKAADLLAGARQTDQIERGPGRHGISNAMFLYLRDPSGHRIELYTSDYLTVDPDLEPLRWSLNDPRRQTLWGHRTPKSWFLEASPVADLNGATLPTTDSPLEGIPEHVI
jgi:catechol 2,3-dioxygenase